MASTQKQKPIVVVKIGTSSLTDEQGNIEVAAIEKLCNEVVAVRNLGWNVLIVTSGAVASGLPPLKFAERPTKVRDLQAASAVGQSRIAAIYDQQLGVHGVVGAQILLVPYDFAMRSQHQHATQTLNRLLELGAVPVINENDAIAAEEIRFGDNDRLAALVAHSVGAELLVLLTDIDGVYSDDPRKNPDAELIREVAVVTPEMEERAKGKGSARGSGGMLSKLTAAKMATFSGARAVIARSTRPNVLVDAVNGATDIGTTFLPQTVRLSPSRLWIAYAARPLGEVHVDGGAGTALRERGASLLAAGVTRVAGKFDPEDCVEILDDSGAVIARGLARLSSDDAASWVGSNSSENFDGVVVHRDQMVVSQ